jgi:hypothetical protein
MRNHCPRFAILVTGVPERSATITSLSFVFGAVRTRMSQLM